MESSKYKFPHLSSTWVDTLSCLLVTKPNGNTIFLWLWRYFLAYSPCTVYAQWCIVDKKAHTLQNLWQPYQSSFRINHELPIPQHPVWRSLWRRNIFKLYKRQLIQILANIIKRFDAGDDEIWNPDISHLSFSKEANFSIERHSQSSQCLRLANRKQTWNGWERKRFHSVERLLYANSVHAPSFFL